MSLLTNCHKDVLLVLLHIRPTIFFIVEPTCCKMSAKNSSLNRLNKSRRMPLHSKDIFLFQIKTHYPSKEADARFDLLLSSDLEWVSREHQRSCGWNGLRHVTESKPTSPLTSTPSTRSTSESRTNQKADRPLRRHRSGKLHRPRTEPPSARTRLYRTLRTRSVSFRFGASNKLGRRKKKLRSKRFVTGNEVNVDMAKHLSCLLILALAVAGSLADDSVELGDSNFDSSLETFDTSLVMFYAPW